MEATKNDELFNVSTYLKEIEGVINRRSEKKYDYVFRGEIQDYGATACMPNIFRDMSLLDTEYFELNLLNSMRQREFTAGESYLEDAINAQHDGFPSRLLDVSDNCLVALYFAVDPYKPEEIKERDQKPGYVYVFFIEDIYNPRSDNTRETFDAIIRHKKKWLENNNIFAANHKYIGTSKINKRIIAQQGAFILFPGNSYVKLPEYMYEKIEIPAKAKPVIREELKKYFGIHRGFIYPEATNFVDEIKKESKLTQSDSFSPESELKQILRTMERELRFQLGKILDETNENMCLDKLIKAERYINWYREGFILYINSKKTESAKRKAANVIQDDYNGIIEEFFNTLAIYSVNQDLSALELLKIQCGFPLSED